MLIGQNGGYNTNDELVEQIENAIEYNGSKKYIVIGLTTGTKSSRESLEMVMSHRFGVHYVNARKYLSTYGLADAKLQPTEQDTADMKNGTVPKSLRTDDVHLNAKGYTVLGNLVYKKGKDLNYWS